MKKVIHLICITTLIFFSYPQETTRASLKYGFQNSTNISTWLWDTSRIILESDLIVENLSNHHVNGLYLQIDTTIENKVYQTFIAKATAKGIDVHALDGAPAWADSNGPNLQDKFLNWLKVYQKVAATNEKFMGIHLDVEPYEHERYEEQSKQLLKRYQTMMITFKEEAGQMNLEFGIDIPFWFYGVTYNNQYGKGDLAEFLCQYVKNITIMAYRDTAVEVDGIIGISTKEMKMFKEYNVKGSIAVETGRLTDDYKFVTFYEESSDYMYEQLDLVYDHYKDDSAFAGIAIHYYDSWMDMK